MARVGLQPGKFAEFSQRDQAGDDIHIEGEPAQPERVEPRDDEEVVHAEVSHVPQHQIIGADIIEQAHTDHLVLFGGVVQLAVEDVASQQVEGQVNLAAGRVAAGVAVSGKLLRIALGKAQRGGILDHDPPEGGCAGKRQGSARTMAADM